MLLRLFLGVEFSFYFRMRDSNKSPHKIRELAKVTRVIPGGRVGVS